MAGVIGKYSELTACRRRWPSYRRLVATRARTNHPFSRVLLSSHSVAALVGALAFSLDMHIYRKPVSGITVLSIRPASLSAMSCCKTRIMLLTFLCLLQLVSTVNGDGLGASNESAICVQTEREIRALIINADQAKNGVEGGVMVANDCKKLVTANVIGYRTDEEQKALCDNSCYATMNEKYKILLANDCFASNDTDEDASANLQAVAYQLACQTTVAGKYCTTLIANAGTKYDLCSDIIKDMGCCFQSYKQYMQYGTPTSITTLNTIQETCTKDGVSGLDTVCPCGPANLYNKYAFNGTKICSAASTLRTTLVTMLTVGLSTMTVWLAA